MAPMLLVELTAEERFHRAVAFPFVQGLLRQRNLPCRWLRFALAADARVRQAESGVGLQPAALQRLCEIVHADRVSHVLVFPEPSPTLLRSLEAMSPGLRVGTLVEVASNPQGLPCLGVEATTRGVLAFVDGSELQGEPDNLFDRVVPDFAWEPGNEEARRAPSLPFIVCGEECTWNRSLRAAPAFADLDLGPCARTSGCSFCRRPAGQARWQHSPAELMRRQLGALQQTHPAAGRLAIRAPGEPVLRNLEQAARVLLELELRPSDLLVDARVDTLLTKRPVIEAALELLASSSHRIQLCLMGIESFAADDLALMNKGVSWQQNLDAIAALFDLETAFPKHFGFREHGGLSLLWFHPWTRLQDLSLNYAVVRRCLLGGISGKLFSARLRLYPDLPLHALASAQGLLTQGYDDELLDTARRNFYPDEVPWRFVDAAVEPLNRLLLRLEHGVAGAADPVQALLDKLLSAGADRMQAAEAMIDAALAQPGPCSCEQLVALARARLAADASVAAPPPSEAGAALFPPEVLGVLAGLKPVGRVESAGAPALLPAPLGDPPLVVVRRQQPASAGQWDTFVSRERASIDRAMALLDTRDLSASVPTLREVGELLGYPPCCTQAFVARPHRLRESYSWMHVLLRISHDGEVSPLMNPGSEALVYWVPCSLSCEASLQAARTMLDAVRKYNGPQAAARIEAESSNPWLLLMDRDACALELLPDGDLSGRVKYRAGRLRGNGALLRDAARGEALEIDEQQLVVLRAGRAIASLGARAMLWWHKAPVQRELWTRLFRLRYQPGAGRLEFDRPELEPTKFAPGPVTRLVMALLREGAGQRFDGFRLVAVEAERNDVARVVLACDHDTLPLLVASGRQQRQAWAVAGPLAIYHRREHPLDTPGKQAAARSFTRYLERAMSARLRG